MEDSRMEKPRPTEAHSTMSRQSGRGTVDQESVSAGERGLDRSKMWPAAHHGQGSHHRGAEICLSLGTWVMKHHLFLTLVLCSSFFLKMLAGGCNPYFWLWSFLYFHNKIPNVSVLLVSVFCVIVLRLQTHAACPWHGTPCKLGLLCSSVFQDPLLRCAQRSV